MNLTLTRKEVNCYWSVVMSGRDQVGSGIGGFRLMMEARNRKQEATLIVICHQVVQATVIDY